MHVFAISRKAVLASWAIDPFVTSQSLYCDEYHSTRSSAEYTLSFRANLQVTFSAWMFIEHSLPVCCHSGAHAIVCNDYEE